MINRLKPKSEFSRNVLTLMTGTAIAQAIPIAISPILTRIYTPEDFGVLGLYMSVALLFSSIATGRYELAIMLPRKESDAFNILALSVSITIVISFITLIVILFFNEKITLLLNSPNISNWLYFIPLSILLTGFYQSFNYWHNKQKDYKLIAKSRIAQSLSTNLTNVSIGLNSGSTQGGMILGSIVGQIVSTYILGKDIWYQDKYFFNKIKKIKIFALAKKYKKFPLINSLHVFINTLKENYVNIFIAIKYTQETLGYYYFMLRIMKLPVGLMGSALAQVFYKEGSEQYNKNKNIQVLVSRLIIKLFLLAIIPISFLYLFSEDIFRIVFGEEWKIAGTYAQKIAPYILFHFIASPLGMIPLIVNKQEIAIFWGLAESILFVSVFVLGNMLFEDIEITLHILSFTMGIYFLIYFKWLYEISGGNK